MDCTVWNERHRTRLACSRPGARAHRDIERGKVPSAARVACIAIRFVSVVVCIIFSFLFVFLLR